MPDDFNNETEETLFKTVPDPNHTIAARNTPPEEFYGKDDSCYIRVQFTPDNKSFKFEVKNEILDKYTVETLPQSLADFVLLIRGMLEVTLQNPHEMYKVGVAAMERDFIHMQDDLTDEQKDLLMNVKGNA